MALFFSIQTLLCVVFLTNVSKTYGLKAELEKDELSTMNIEENEKEECIKPIKTFLREIFSNFNITLLLI